MFPFSLFPIFILFTFLTTTTIEASSSTSNECLKLPLLHRTAFLSSAQTAQALSALNSPIVSGASSGSGQYFVSLKLGTPPQNLLLVADTGSDLIWTKCSACRRDQNCSASSSASFLPRKSTSFSPHHCYSSPCRLVPRPSRRQCNHTRLHSPCQYSYSYSDGSTTSGFFSHETTRLVTSSGRVKKIKRFNFGCGFKVSGPSVTGPSFNGAHGVIGLGRGPISFSSQLGRKFGNKFSYCLMDYTLSPPSTSFLSIGGAHNESVKFRFTPLEINPLSPTFYYIAIQHISIDGVKLPVNPSIWAVDKFGNGGTVIDSGTTLTFLAEPAYKKVLAAYKKLVKLPSLNPAERPPGFDLCMNVTELTSEPILPRLSFELKGGSVFEPPTSNYFIETGENVMCLAIQPVATGPGFSVIGNLMQQGFLFEFDRDRSRLGFSRHGCALP